MPLGRAAAELLFDEINEGGAHGHRQVLFDRSWWYGESSGPPPNSAPSVPQDD